MKQNFTFRLWNIRITALVLFLIVGKLSMAQLHSNNFDTDLGWTVVNKDGHTNVGWTREVQGENPGISPYNGEAMAKFAAYNITAGNRYELNSPAIAFTGGNYQITFQMYRDNGYPAKEDKIEVFYNTTAGSDEGTSLGTIYRSTSLSPMVSDNGWYEYSFLIPGTPNGDGYISLLATSGYGNNMYIDEITVEEQPSCLKPSGIEINNIMGTSVDISWTASPTATEGYEYYYSTENVAPTNSSDILSTTNTTVTLIDLLPTTNYFVWVRSVCNADEQSDWVTGGFRTDCMPFTVNYQENFEGQEIGGMTECWTQKIENPDNNATSSIGRSDSEHYSGAYSMKIYTSADIQGNYYIISPEFSDLDNNKIIYVYLMRKLGGNDPEISGSFDIGIMTDVNDASTYTSLQNIPLSELPEQEWQEIMVTTDAYTGNGGHIVIKHTPGTTQWNFLYIDDFRYEEIPACVKPSAIQITNITSNSADISWTVPNQEPAEGYEYYLSTDDTAPDETTEATAMSSTPTVSLTELNYATDYYVWVRSACSEEDKSEWAGYKTFQTSCGIITPDYFQDFETFVPGCWINAEGNEFTPMGIIGGNWIANGFLNNGETGSACINIWGIDIHSWLISPLFDLSQGGYQLSFDYGLTKNANNDAGQLGADDQIQLKISENEGATWTTIQTWTAADSISNTSNTYTYNITSTSNQVKFAIYADSGTANNIEDNNFYIDNFKIETSGGNEEVNMDNYIQLTVQSNESIRLTLCAAADNTPIKIVSGTKVYDVILNADWTSNVEYLSGSDTMTIYGNLDKFNCYYNSNKITAIDAGHNNILTHLDCGKNDLTYLNVANGNNANITFMGADQNPNLMCIQHDADFNPNAHPYNPIDLSGWNKDQTAQWSTDCNAVGIENEALFNDVTIYPNPFSNLVMIDNILDIHKIEVIDINGKTVKSFKAQKELNLSELNSGIYVVRLRYNDNSVKLFKVIKK